MQHVVIFTFGAFGSCLVLLASGMLLVAQLFKLLEHGHARYYKLIGQPKVFGYTDSIDEYSQRLKGAVFIYSMVFKGVPDSFPKDRKLRRLAQAVRCVFTVFVALFVALIVLTYFYYKSGQ